MARRKRSEDATDDTPTLDVEPASVLAPTVAPAIARLHARSELGVIPWRRPPAHLGRSQGIVVHCTGSVRPTSPEHAVQRIRRIVTAHMGARRMVDGKNVGGRGWPHEGYHWAVTPWGDVWQLLGWGLYGSHAKTGGFNAKSHGIVLLGKGTELTDAEWSAVLWLVADHDRRFGPGFVIGHKEIGVSKACPGPVVLERVQALGRGL